MQELDLFPPDLGEMQVLDKADSRLQRATDVTLVIPNLTQSELGFLPKVLITALGNRHIKFVADAGLDLPQYRAFFFQRVTLIKVQREPQDPDHHLPAFFKVRVT